MANARRRWSRARAWPHERPVLGATGVARRCPAVLAGLGWCCAHERVKPVPPGAPAWQPGEGRYCRPARPPHRCPGAQQGAAYAACGAPVPVTGCTSAWGLCWTRCCLPSAVGARLELHAGVLNRAASKFYIWLIAAARSRLGCGLVRAVVSGASAVCAQRRGAVLGQLWTCNIHPLMLLCLGLSFLCAFTLLSVPSCHLS